MSCILKKNARINRRKGFSLVELVVVIGILIILASAVFLGGATVIRQSRESVVRSDLRNYGTYVQDMFYSNPDMQSNVVSYNVQESFTMSPQTGFLHGDVSATLGAYNTATIYASSLTSDTIKTKFKVLNVLNNRYLTDDFQLNGTTLDPWDNAYCYSFAMAPSENYGDPAACIMVISSMGMNAIDETSDVSNNPANVKGVAENVVRKLGTTGYSSATDVVNSLEVAGHTGDDYGVVIVMLDGQVSTDYYGF